MLGSATAVTSSASTNTAVAFSVPNAAHSVHFSIPCTTISVPQSRTLFQSHQSSPTTSCKITAFTVKAMAETISTQKLDTKSSLSGKKQALISLSDKKDLALLGNGLQELGFMIVSTGGTASALESSGVSVTKVEELTCFPEMLDGRVKTLHPNIHGGILARRDLEHHMESLNKHGIGTFDVVVVNLYPIYDKVSSSSGISFEDGIENIDIGGPAMIRAAAKDAQFAWLCVKHVKSNAIVIAKNNCMLGMGSGQPNRLESLRIALRKAGDEVKGAALASDAFFPFAWNDAVEEACESGIGVIAEPGGSIRDADAIECCNKYGVSLIFTNIRHFRH